MADLILNETARRIIATLADLGGSASPGDVGSHAGIGTSAQAKWIRRLKTAGLIQGDKRSVTLTPTGWAETSGLQQLTTPEATPAAASLADAIGTWPTLAHQAFCWLMLSAVVARHHLGQARPEGHPNFIAAGYTGSGKTSPARFICRLLGHDPAQHVLLLARQTEGTIAGRRERTAEAGWRYMPSPLSSLDGILCFDEFDKAPLPLRTHALLYFHDLTQVDPDTGTPFSIRPVPVLTANTSSPGGLDQFPLEYQRRSVLLHTDPLRPQLADIDQALRRLDQHALPTIDLAAHQPPHLRVPDDTHQLIRDLMRRCLTEHGWELCELRALELLTLGYAGLTHEPLERAALAVCLAYLTCADTVADTQPDWPATIAAAAGLLRGGDTVASALMVEWAADQHRQLTERPNQCKLEQAVEMDAVVADRARLAEHLNQTARAVDLRSIPPARRPDARAIRAILDRLHRETVNSRSETALTQIKTRAQPYLDDQTRLLGVARADQEARGRAQAAAAQAAREEADKRRAARAELKQIRTWIRQAERLATRTHTRPNEDPIAILASLGVIVYHQPERRPAPSTKLEHLASVLAVFRDGSWQSPYDARLVFHGRRPAALSEWGATTHQVIEAAVPAARQAEQERLTESPAIG